MVFSLTDALETASLVLQICGAVVIALSGLTAIVSYSREYVGNRGIPAEISAIRYHLARGLVLGLEFLIGADIVRTVTVPTWQEIGTLAAIIVIRTILSLTLEHETRRSPDS